MAALRPETLLGTAPSVSPTRDRLADAAVRLFATRPIADVSLPDVANEAGVHLSTVYRNFEGRMSELLSYLGERSDEHVRSVVAALTASIGDVPPRELVASVATQLFAIITRGPIASMLANNPDAVISYALTPCGGLRTTTGELLRDYAGNLELGGNQTAIAEAADRFVYDLLSEWVRAFPRNDPPDADFIAARVDDLFEVIEPPR